MIGLRVRILKQKYLQKINHIQPFDAAGFSMVYLILNCVTYFSTKSAYTFYRFNIKGHGNKN